MGDPLLMTKRGKDALVGRKGNTREGKKEKVEKGRIIYGCVCVCVYNYTHTYICTHVDVAVNMQHKRRSVQQNDKYSAQELKAKIQSYSNIHK